MNCFIFFNITKACPSHEVTTSLLHENDAPNESATLLSNENDEQTAASATLNAAATSSSLSSKKASLTLNLVPTVSAQPEVAQDCDDDDTITSNSHAPLLANNSSVVTTPPSMQQEATAASTVEVVEVGATSSQGPVAQSTAGQRKPAFNPLYVILKDKNKYHTTEYI